MSKKKNANIERNTNKKKAKEALRQSLENLLVKNTGIALVLAVLFAVFNNYKKSAELAGGMIALFNILIWAGVAAVLVFAILGAVKKDASLYKWSAVGAINSVIWFLFARFSAYKTSLISGVAYSYYAILAFMIFTVIYYFLALSGVWNKKAVRVVFYVVATLLAVALLVSAIVFMYLNGNITGVAH